MANYDPVSKQRFGCVRAEFSGTDAPATGRRFPGHSSLPCPGPISSANYFLGFQLHSPSSDCIPAESLDRLVAEIFKQTFPALGPEVAQGDPDVLSDFWS